MKSQKRDFIYMYNTIYVLYICTTESLFSTSETNTTR